MTTALLAGLGYIIAMASVIAISGGFMQITLNHYTGVDLPWIIWTVLLTGLSVVLMLRGIVVSTKWAGYFFGVEMLVLVVVSVAALVEHRGDLSAAPFLPSPPHPRRQRPGGGLPAGGVPVHRLGELGGTGRGDGEPAAQCRPRRVLRPSRS